MVCITYDTPMIYTDPRYHNIIFLSLPEPDVKRDLGILGTRVERKKKTALISALRTNKSDPTLYLPAPTTLTATT